MSIVVKNACKRRKGYLYYIDPDGNLVETKMGGEMSTASKNKIKKLKVHEMKIKFLENDLKHKERVYGEYIKALVKYNIKELAYSAIMYDELYHNLLMRRVEQCRDNDKSFMKLMFGDGKKLNDIEKLEDQIKYQDKLINRCRNIIEGSQDPIKEKIAKDAVEKSLAWLTTPEIFPKDANVSGDEQ